MSFFLGTLLKVYYQSNKVYIVVTVLSLPFTLQLVGAILFSVGIFIKLGLRQYLDPIVGPVLESIPILPDLLNMVGVNSLDPNDHITSKLDVEVIVNSAAIALIVIGFVILVLSVLGGIGACCSSRIILIVVRFI